MTTALKCTSGVEEERQMGDEFLTIETFVITNALAYMSASDQWRLLLKYIVFSQNVLYKIQLFKVKHQRNLLTKLSYF